MTIRQKGRRVFIVIRTNTSVICVFMTMAAAIVVVALMVIKSNTAGVAENRFRCNSVQIMRRVM